MNEHIDFDQALAQAADVGEGWKRFTVRLTESDTVFDPGSTKTVLTGAGEWAFLIHPSGVQIEKRPDRWFKLPRRGA